MRRLEFDPAAFDDLAWWVRRDRKLALKLFELLESIRRDPTTGIGKPEPLKNELSGCWSRRIDQEHRVVYQVTADAIRVLACRYHY